MTIVVDPEDEWLLREFTWHAIRGCVMAKIWCVKEQRQYHALLHHCIVGQPIDGSDVDHIDRDICNNRRSNLRYISHSRNGVNSDRVDDATHITETRYGKFQLRIARDGVRHHIGNYDTREEAKEARDQWLSTYEDQFEHAT